MSLNLKLLKPTNTTSMRAMRTPLRVDANDDEEQELQSSVQFQQYRIFVAGLKNLAVKSMPDITLTAIMPAILAENASKMGMTREKRDLRYLKDTTRWTMYILMGQENQLNTFQTRSAALNENRKAVPESSFCSNTTTQSYKIPVIGRYVRHSAQRSLRVSHYLKLGMLFRDRGSCWSSLQKGNTGLQFCKVIQVPLNGPRVGLKTFPATKHIDVWYKNIPSMIERIEIGNIQVIVTELQCDLLNEQFMRATFVQAMLATEIFSTSWVVCGLFINCYRLFESSMRRAQTLKILK